MKALQLLIGFLVTSVLALEPPPLPKIDTNLTVSIQKVTNAVVYPTTVSNIWLTNEAGIRQYQVREYTWTDLPSTNWNRIQYEFSRSDGFWTVYGVTSTTNKTLRWQETIGTNPLADPFRRNYMARVMLIWDETPVFIEPEPKPALVFLPTDDAYIQSGVGFNDKYLKAESTNRIVYLKFDVTGVSGVVERTILRLREGGDPGKGTFRVFQGSHSNWTETTLSTSSMPVKGAELGSFTGSVATNQVVDIPLSNITTNNVYSLIVQQDAGGNDVWFGSKESINLPSLLIEVR